MDHFTEELIAALKEQLANCFDPLCEMCARHEQLLARTRASTRSDGEGEIAATRYHFTDENPFAVATAEGIALLGKGWLAISEGEYAKLATNDAAGRREGMLAAARIIEDMQEAVLDNAHGTTRYLSPRKHGNLVGLAYADAIRAAAEEG